MSAAPEILANPLEETPLSQMRGAGAATVGYRGALTPLAYSSLDAKPTGHPQHAELAALTTGAGIFDLGYMESLRITGADRVRWLNGMVTNTIKALPEWHWNYSLVLNPQGRIQGDVNVYCAPDTLFLETDRAQMGRLTAHLRRYIIMDKVELAPVDDGRTLIGIAGPKAAEILSNLGAAVPEEGAFAEARFHGAEVILAHAYSPLVPRFELLVGADALGTVWDAMRDSRAEACGVRAMEALRILEGTPLYGVDILDKHLAQETGQARAMNFTKGCYLGQEIVERVRSRGNVHRVLKQFAVENAPAGLEPGQTLELNAEGAERNPVGELTSLAHYALPSFTGALALGFIRTEAVESKLPLRYEGGAVTILDAPPALQ
ncbi:MAG: YgfZ/GcvT domain-containing protein [Acidobacteriaceae bacterium]